MSELGELLELLYSARHSFRTARGAIRQRYSWRLTQEVAKRENARRRGGAAGGGSLQVMLFSSRRTEGEEPPPDLHEQQTRFWFEPPDRLREESESQHSSHTTVIDGDLWWTYTPEWGSTSNVGLSEEEAAEAGTRGGGESFRQLLDPSALLAVLEIDEIEIEGDRLLVRARPRDDLDDFHRHTQLHVSAGADRIDLVVDRERGAVLRIAAYLEGAELSVTELEELAFDETFPDGTFVFVPPAGEEVRPPEIFEHREYSLEEAAELAGFTVFEISELPEGPRRSHVHYSPARERPPMHTNVGLFYHLAGSRGSLIVSQHKAGEGGGFGWPGIHPDGPPVEELERDGMRYSILRGDPEEGYGSAVTFERDGTAIQLQAPELDADTLLDLAASLRPVE